MSTFQYNGNPFTPVGANYVRLDSSNNHITMEPAAYDGVRAQAAFSAMVHAGYNTVRITLDCTTFESGFGLSSPGVSSTYVANLADILSRAATVGIRVALCAERLPNNYQFTAGSTNASGNSLELLDARGSAARAQLWTDLINGIIGQNLVGGISALSFIDIANEICVSTADLPWSQTSGTYTFSGNNYDLSNSGQRQSLLDAATTKWFSAVYSTLRNNVSALTGVYLSASLFSPLEISLSAFNGVNGNYTNYPLKASAILAGGADYVEFHDYPYVGASWNPTDSFNSALLNDLPIGTKIFLTETGAVQSAFTSVQSAATTLQQEILNIGSLGGAGWLIWTWDTSEETPAFYLLSTNLLNLLPPNTPLVIINNNDPTTTQATNYSSSTITNNIFDYSIPAAIDDTVEDIDFSLLLTELVGQNPLFTDFITTLNYIYNRNIKDPIDSGLRQLRTENSEPYFAALSSQMLGFKMPAFAFTNFQYQLLMDSLGTFYQTRGASTQFINYLGYILNVEFVYQPLYANSLTMSVANFVPDPPGTTIDKGGVWFATPYFDVSYDPSVYTIDDATALLFIKNLAPIHLVLRDFIPSYVTQVSCAMIPIVQELKFDFTICVTP